MASVRLENLTKMFREVVAVSDLTLDVKDKEFLVLVGPSGCGKTTALRMIAGLEEATEGDMYIGDRRVKIRSRVDGAANMLGIGELLHRKPKQLSGGQRQRVALGRAIVREPKVFLMDEPLSNLDAKLRVQTRAELIKLHRRLGITTVYVTHDQVEAMTMGDRIAVLNEGVMQQCDTPLNLYNRPVNRFVAGFIGSPAMNFLDGAVASDNGSVFIETSYLRLELPPERAEKVRDGGYVGRDVIFGIRPEDMHDCQLSHVPSTDGNTGTVRIDVMEPMGDRVVVYALVGEATVLCSLDSNTAAVEETDLEIVFDMSKCHLFDKDTEDSLLH